MLFQQLDSSGQPALYTLSPHGEVHPLIEGRSAGSPSITKDGRWMAYCVWNDAGIHVGRAYDAPSVIIATRSGCFPQWSPDEDRLYYQDDGKLWSMTAKEVHDAFVFGDPELVADLGRTPLSKLYDIDESGRMVLVRHADAGVQAPVLVTNWIGLID